MAPTLRERFQLSLGQAGVLISASLVGSLFSLIPWGLATDRAGERTVLVTGLGLCGATLIGAAWAHGFWILFLLLVLAGLTGSGVQAASGRSVMHWFDPAERGFALGIRQTAIPLSGFAVALLLPTIVGAGGAGWGFAAMGAAVLAGAFVGGRFSASLPGLIRYTPCRVGDSRCVTAGSGGSRSGAGSCLHRNSASPASPSSTSTTAAASPTAMTLWFSP